MALTDAAIRALPHQDKPYKKADGRGLVLLVHPNGSKYFEWYYRFPATALGKQKTLRLGVYPRISLAKARRLSDDARRLREEGLDPGEERKRQKLQQLQEHQQATFESVGREWHERQAGHWSERHCQDVLGKLEKDVFPTIGALPINAIDAPTCTKIIRRIEQRGASETARRSLSIMGQIFDYAMAHGQASVNPAQPLKGHALRKTTPGHHPCLRWQEVAPFLRVMEANPARADDTTMRAMQLLMLTFVRTSELIKSEWKEFNLEKRLWTIPAERMKGRQGHRKEHLVPLSRQAVALLEKQYELTGPEGWVFASTRSRVGHISNNTINMTLRRMGYQDRMCGHGFRALAMTNIQEHLKVPIHIVDRQLAHVESNKVQAAYNRAKYIEERTEMMQRWADLLQGEEGG